jgi:tetratricopeptide (TPR) repeat protein
MKKNAFVIVMGLIMALPISAQSWNSWDTHRTISGVFGIANAAIESAERKKEMEIQARQKVEFEQSFKDAMTEAKAYEAQENWEEALEKYEEAAKLNCKYSYTDQKTLTRKITSLYVKGGREDDGPSILNNAKTILPDYSGYYYMKENPVFVNKKKAAGVQICRVACSTTETRIEMETEALSANMYCSIKGSTYIKGNKGGKLGLETVENVTMDPARTYIPWPHQKLRFALIFPPLPAEAKEFDLIVPSSVWQFKDIKCK